MGLFEHFPYTNFHELNLDWVIKTVNDVDNKTDTLANAVDDLRANQTDDINAAVNAQLETMRNSGELADITVQLASPQISGMRKHNPDLTKVLFIGDSFNGDWYTEQGYQSYVHILATKLGLVMGETYANYAYGGAGYVAGDNVNHRNYQQNFLADIVPNEGAGLSTYSAVVVFSGPNDYSQTYETEYGAVDTFISTVKQYMPNADIIGITGGTFAPNYYTTTQAILDAYLHNRCITTTSSPYWMIGRTTDFLADALHPNASGMELLAGYIYNALCGYDGPAPHATFSTDDNGSTLVQYDGLITHIYCVSKNHTDITPSGYAIGTLPTILRPDTFTSIGCTTTISTADIGGVFADTDGTIKFFPAKNTSAPGSVTWKGFISTLK